jgi:signal transduction histidine kinase
MNFKFLRDNKQVVYSIAVIILIPGLVILNTWFFAQSYNKTIELTLYDKAIQIGQTFNAGISDKLDSPEAIQLFINDWKNYNEDTSALDIYYPDSQGFKLVASMDNQKELGATTNSYNYSSSWSTGNIFAQRIVEPDGNSTKSYWTVIMPLKNLQGEKQAIIAMKVSSDKANAKLVESLYNAYWILLATVLFIILLLLGNSRLFEYSILYNKIKEVDAMKDEFISMASHELRTPVTVIRGYATMMLEESEKLGVNQEAKDYLSIIDVSSERLNSLIEDLLNVSRIEQGRLKVELKDMEVWPIVEETVKEMKLQAETKGLTLSCILEPNAKSLIAADKDRLKQILINTIGNSIKYTPKGSIEVRALNRENNLVLMIKDTGIGMTAKQREHLFEKFYRIKTKQTEDIVGTGLGLWITKQIIELMKGTITIDSMENVGTQVTLEFPLIK